MSWQHRISHFQLDQVNNRQPLEPSRSVYAGWFVHILVWGSNHLISQAGWKRLNLVSLSKYVQMCKSSNAAQPSFP